MHNKKMAAWVWIIGLALMPSASHCVADSPLIQPQETGRVGGFLGIGFTLGGDTIDEVNVETFGDVDSEDVDAGDGLFFSGGLVYHHSEFQLQFTAGYYTAGFFGSDGDKASFTRWPVEAIAFWKQEKFRLGAGVTHHLNPKYDFDVDGFDEDINYDDATGFVVQAEYLLDQSIGIGVRFTSIEYEASNSINPTVDGDSVGLIMSYAF